MDKSHLAVIRGVIPPVTREEKDALIRYLKIQLSEAKHLLTEARCCIVSDETWVTRTDRLLAALNIHLPQ